MNKSAIIGIILVILLSGGVFIYAKKQDKQAVTELREKQNEYTEHARQASEKALQEASQLDELSDSPYMIGNTLVSKDEFLAFKDELIIDLSSKKVVPLNQDPNYVGSDTYYKATHKKTGEKYTYGESVINGKESFSIWKE